jgi:hypothetical protein
VDVPLQELGISTAENVIFKIPLQYVKSKATSYMLRSDLEMIKISLSIYLHCSCMQQMEEIHLFDKRGYCAFQEKQP